MNRLDHLQSTLPANLEAIRASREVAEVVLVDYGSTDGMREWILATQREAIDEGLLTVYRTDEPQYFQPAHAKNIAHRLSQYEVLCNVDADNFISPEFIDFVRRRFRDGQPHVMHGRRCSWGRIALRRSDFFELGGYNEDFHGWGTEDCDLIERMKAAHNIKALQLRRFDRFLQHSHERRTALMPIKDPRVSRAANDAIMRAALAAGQLVANAGRTWGYAHVVRNYQVVSPIPTTAIDPHHPPHWTYPAVCGSNATSS